MICSQIIHIHLNEVSKINIINSKKVILFITVSKCFKLINLISLNFTKYK